MDKVSLNIADIEKLLPHRYPFLMVDRVTELVAGKYAKGYKNISCNEPYFPGHFPGMPIMPGVLQIEAAAQLACLVMLKLPEYSVGYFGMFAGIDSFKFRKKVVPGDRLDMEVQLVKFRFPYGKFEITAKVDGELCAEGVIAFVMAENRGRTSTLDKVKI